MHAAVGGARPEPGPELGRAALLSPGAWAGVQQLLPGVPAVPACTDAGRALTASVGCSQPIFVFPSRPPNLWPSIPDPFIPLVSADETQCFP